MESSGLGVCQIKDWKKLGYVIVRTCLLRKGEREQGGRGEAGETGAGKRHNWTLALSGMCCPVHPTLGGGGGSDLKNTHLDTKTDLTRCECPTLLGLLRLQTVSLICLYSLSIILFMARCHSNSNVRVALDKIFRNFEASHGNLRSSFKKLQVQSA